jgi:predicted DNA-binding antitoxin AbrB/MazE fold protein
MTTTVRAIYEQGVLRLTEPISLREGESVDVIVISNEPAPDSRKAAEILAAIAAMPMEPGGKEFSGRDHDNILYGDAETR